MSEDHYSYSDSFDGYGFPSEKNYSYSAAGAEYVPSLTEDQQYLIAKLEPYFVGFPSGIGKREVRALNRRFGVGRTTSALRAFLGQMRDGYDVRNPFSLLWTIVERTQLEGSGA